MLLSLFTTFQGRISRKQWWIGTVLLALVSLPLEVYLDPTSFSSDVPLHAPPLAATIVSMLFLIPDTALTVKRFNDRGWPWWLGYALNAAWLIMFVSPHFGAFVDPDAGIPNAVAFWLLLVATLLAVIDNGFLRGTAGPNRYGEDPLAQVGPATAVA